MKLQAQSSVLKRESIIQESTTQREYLFESWGYKKYSKNLKFEEMSFMDGPLGMFDFLVALSKALR